MVLKLGLTLMLKLRLRLFKIRLLKKILGPRCTGVYRRAEKNYTVRSFTICTPHQILFG
jgi:hypothetical protein